MSNDDRVTVTWVLTYEMKTRGMDGTDAWVRTSGVEVDEATAREFYQKCIDDGMPDHLRHPRLTRITREIVEEVPF